MFIPNDIIQNISVYIGYQILTLKYPKYYTVCFNLNHFSITIHVFDCHSLIITVTEKKSCMSVSFEVIIQKQYVVCKHYMCDKTFKQHFLHNESLNSYYSEIDWLVSSIIFMNFNLLENSPKFQTLKQSFCLIYKCVLNVLSDSLKVPKSNYYEITEGHQFEQECVMELLNTITTNWIKNYSE